MPVWLLMGFIAAHAQSPDGARQPSLDLVGLEDAERGATPAYRALVRQKRAESIHRLKALLDRGVNDDTLAEIQLRLADLYYQDGADNDAALPLARDLYAKLRQDFPRYPRTDQVLFYFARTQVLLGDTFEATEALQELVRRYPDSAFRPDALLHLAELASDPAAALVLWEQATRAEPLPSAGPNRVAYAQYRLGWATLQHGDRPGGEAWLRQVAAGDDPVVAAAAQADLLTAFGAPPLSGCAAVADELAAQVAADPAQAPLRHLDLVRCWLSQGDEPSARDAAEGMDVAFGPGTGWRKQHSRREISAAKDALRKADRLVPH